MQSGRHFEANSASIVQPRRLNGGTPTIAKNRAPKVVLPNRRYVDHVIWLVALCALAFSNYAPTNAAIVFVAAALLYVALKPAVALRDVVDGSLPWYYVVLSVVSVLWSQDAGLTTRYVTEFAITTGVALLMARALTPAAFLSVLMSALLVTDVASMLVARTALNAGEFAMIGVFGSKNAFSEAHGTLFLVSCWVLVGSRQSAIMRLLALFGVVSCPILLVAGRSADAIFATIVASGVSIVVYQLRWLSHKLRVVTTSLAAATAAAIVLFFYSQLDNIQSQMLSLTGKDVTLSGRTYLWERAAALISENPLLGTGYGAFWVHGNPYAEELWAHFGLVNRAGFNFHNMWYDAAVQLGYPGEFVAAFTVIFISIEVFRWFIRTPSAESCFFLAFVCYADVRTTLETELFSQFDYPWVVLLAAWVYARDNRKYGGVARVARPAGQVPPVGATLRRRRSISSAASAWPTIAPTANVPVAREVVAYVEKCMTLLRELSRKHIRR